MYDHLLLGYVVMSSLYTLEIQIFLFQLIITYLQIIEHEKNANLARKAW